MRPDAARPGRTPAEHDLTARQGRYEGSRGVSQPGRAPGPTAPAHDVWDEDPRAGSGADGSPAVEVRECAQGRACEEVTSRLVAADRSEAEGHPEAAEQLRTSAARFAEVHGYGQAEEGAA